MKEVKNQVKKEVKETFLLDIINAINEGKNLAQIAKQLKTSKQRIGYYANKLKVKGLIKKIGYGVWETSKNSSRVTLIKEVRGHAFIWKVKLPKLKNWDKRKEVLDKLKIPYKLTNLGTPRIVFEGKKVWLGSKHIIIYEPKSFFQEDATKSNKLAIWHLKLFLDGLESKLKTNFKINGTYRFSVAREHYALIKNQLAIQCNKEGEKINVFDDKGLWFVIDNSYHLDEAETLNREALPNNLGVQRYFNEHKETNFEVTPKFILNSLNTVTQNQQVFDRNMSSHLRILQKLEVAVDKLANKVGKLNQTKLSDYENT